METISKTFYFFQELKKRQISEYQAESNRMQIALDAIGMGSPCQTNFEEEPLGNLVSIHYTKVNYYQTFLLGLYRAIFSPKRDTSTS